MSENGEVYKNTQKLLQKHIKKPLLTEKLLRKPPFRFLHDIVSSVVRETGFLKGLFSEGELISENVKEKEAKIAFLNKFIIATKAITNAKLEVRASKIIAGLEPVETNLLLQAIGTALEKKIDSSQYIAELNSTKKITKKPTTIKEKKKVEITPKSTKKTPTEKSIKKSKKPTDDVSTPKVPSKGKKLDKSSSKESARSTNSDTSPKEKIIHREKIKNEEIHETSIMEQVEQVPQEISQVDPSELAPEIMKIVEKMEAPPPAPLERPKSAKPRSAAKKIQETPQEPENNQKMVIKNFLRPPSVRPSSARPGAPRLRSDITLPVEEIVPLGKINVIVENFGNKDEEEVTIIPMVSELDVPVVENFSIPTEKGHLVEQILEQIQETEIGDHTKTKIEWDDLKGKESVNKEIVELKQLIQVSTKIANPLGKLISYLQEDIEAMHEELNMWMQSKRQTMALIAKQTASDDELNRPMQIQLKELQENITKYQELILSSRNNIIKNEIRIKNLIA